MTDVSLIHCSYHKCLTVYYGRVLGAVLNRCLPWSRGYRHYRSHLADFYDGYRRYRIASVNNRAVALDQLGEFRLSRFVRDPRDLVVSGYLYHRRGAESWTTKVAPSLDDWYFANGCVPAGMRNAGVSFAGYLQSVGPEEGLLAELEFRRFHFESMTGWPSQHPQIAVYRYEDVVGREMMVFDRLFEFYGLSPVERGLGRWFSHRYAWRRRVADPHVRDPSPGQWRQHFTPRVKQAFDAEWRTLVRMLGYPDD